MFLCKEKQIKYVALSAMLLLEYSIYAIIENSYILFTLINLAHGDVSDVRAFYVPRSYLGQHIRAIYSKL